eukprot:UN04451
MGKAAADIKEITPDSPAMRPQSQTQLNSPDFHIAPALTNSTKTNIYTEDEAEIPSTHLVPLKAIYMKQWCERYRGAQIGLRKLSQKQVPRDSKFIDELIHTMHKYQDTSYEKNWYEMMGP